MTRIAIALTILLLFALQSTLFSTTKMRVSVKTQDERNEQSYDFVRRLQVIAFGTPANPAATGPQLSEFFDDDQDLGGITLKQIETAPGNAGHSFTTVRRGVTTDWRVLVSADFNGDGLTTGVREGRADLVQIEVYAENRLMFRTFRAADYPNTIGD